MTSDSSSHGASASGSTPAHIETLMGRSWKAEEHACRLYPGLLKNEKMEDPSWADAFSERQVVP
jgi:hypothetical protein